MKKPPLPPYYGNMRARAAEHEKLMAEARRLNPGAPVCPDHYDSTGRCGCRDPLSETTPSRGNKRRSPQGGDE